MCKKILTFAAANSQTKNNSMNFEWDERKNQENIVKHGVSFKEAQLAFFDKKRVIKHDKAHSQEEIRRFCIGDTGFGIATVRFTYRNGNIRIYGAGYWRKGVKLYEKENSLY